MTVDQIRPIDTTEAATTLLNELAESHDWVSVFWDRGWGDNGETADISIIVDGNGKQPHAQITPAVYKALVAQKTVGENTLMTYKARRVHDFKTPPTPEKTEPTSNEVAEQVIRGILRDHAEKPLQVRFYRSLERGTYGPRIVEEVVQTPGAEAGWFVLLIPGHSDVAISAQKPSMLGADIIGGGVADCLPYPKDAAGEPDLKALAGADFRYLLEGVIGEKIAVIEAARA